MSSPTHHGSPALLEHQTDAGDDRESHKNVSMHGVHGTFTSLQLPSRHGFVGRGPRATALIDLACCGPGDHALVPVSAQGPSKRMGTDLLKEQCLSALTEHMRSRSKCLPGWFSVYPGRGEEPDQRGAPTDRTV